MATSAPRPRQPGEFLYWQNRGKPWARALRATGANHLIVSLHSPGMSFAVADDAMRLFAEEVAPRLREAV